MLHIAIYEVWRDAGRLEVVVLIRDGADASQSFRLCLEGSLVSSLYVDLDSQTLGNQIRTLREWHTPRVVTTIAWVIVG